jgi:hypothetical protein
VKYSYTPEEHCNMLLTLDDWNSRASIDTRKFALHYPCRRRPDADVFRQLKQRLRVEHQRNYWLQAAHKLYGHRLIMMS